MLPHEPIMSVVKVPESPESNWAPNDAIYTMMEMRRCDEVWRPEKLDPNCPRRPD